MKFWGQFDKLQKAADSGNRSAAARIADEVYRDQELFGQDPNRKILIDKVCDFHGLRSGLGDHESSDENGSGLNVPFSLDSLVVGVNPGVSLVTSCMNRNDNLVKAIPSWLACHQISEVVIVDWSSDVPVIESLSESEISDPRIRVVRVDDQPRWILSYAFNIGFRAASFEKILKADADINLSPDFFERNHLSKDEFIAGDWRVAEKGQEFINGFFYISREDLLSVNGFNEYITTYGWDDDDIYQRLVDSGLQRRCVDVKTIFHLPHDDARRVREQLKSSCPLAELRSSTRFKIRANRFVANAMPTWNADRILLPFDVVKMGRGYLRLKKTGDSIHYVPEHIQDDANYFAEVELTSWNAGLRAFDLDRKNLRKLLSVKPINEVSKLDLELAIHNPSGFYQPSKNHLILLVEGELVRRRSDAKALIEDLQKYCEAESIGLVISSSNREIIADLLPIKRNVGYVPSWRNVGTVEKLKATDIESSIDQARVKNICFSISDDYFDRSKKTAGVFASPFVSVKKDKIYVDAQHGLGNRLRAIASGAAMANATGRELAIVWEPDHHCECRFSDLFEFDGEVIEQSFIRDASNSGMSVYNYMEIEEGAVKDAVIILTTGKDIYARSAYVLSSEHTSWDNENIFLRNLKPSESVLNLVRPFDTSKKIGAHVRMEAGKGVDHNSYDSTNNWSADGHKELHYWREKSHYSNFIRRIDEYFRVDQEARLFLATDIPETYEIFEKYYGDRVSYLKRSVYDRSKEQIKYALADAILLSGCERLLGSTWSSFSELAMRLSTNFSEIEMSGTDF